jgi:hypothetical protein
MLEYEKLRIQSILAEIKIGEEEIISGSIENYDKAFLSNVMIESKQQIFSYVFNKNHQIRKESLNGNLEIHTNRAWRITMGKIWSNG